MPKFKFGNIKKGKLPEGKWIKNAMKSAKGLSSDLIMQMMPATFDTVQSLSQDAQDARDFLRDFRLNRQKYINDFKRSIGTDKMSEAWSNAKSDLASGNINNSARAEGDDWDLNFDDDMDFGDDIDFGDEDDSYMDEESTEKTTQVINKIAVSNAAPVKSAIQKQTAIMTDNIINSSKINQQLGLMSQQLMQKHTNIVSDGLKAVNDNLSLLVQFNSDSMTSYINASMKYYNDSMELQQKMFDMQQSYFNPQKKDKSSYDSKRSVSDIKKDLLSPYGTFNLKDYLKVIKGNISDTINSSGLGMVTAMGGMMGDELIKNPIGSILSMFLGDFLPGSTKKSINNFDNMVKNFAKGMMMKAARYGNNYSLQSGGFKDNLLFYLGKILGVDQSYKTSINLNTWNNGAIPFDGDTKKSIVEVIPTYLRKILAAVTGQEELFFDTRYNKFTKASALKEDYDKSLRYKTINPYSGTIDKLKGTINRNFSFDSSDDRKEMVKKMENFFSELTKKKGLIDLKGKDQSSFIKDMDDLMNSAGMSYNQQRMFKAAFNSLSKSEQTEALVNSVIESRNNINKYFEDLQKSGTEMFTAARMFQGKNKDGENPNEFLEVNPNFTTKNKQSKLRVKSAFNVFNPADKFGKTTLDYIRNIQDILVKGIRVFSYNMGNAKAKGVSTSSMMSHLSRYSASFNSEINNFNEQKANEAKKSSNYSNSGRQSLDPEKLKEKTRKMNFRGMTRLRRIDDLYSMSDEELTSSMVERANDKKKPNFFQSVSKHIKDKEKQKKFNTISEKITSILTAPGRMIEKSLDFATSTMYGLLFGFDEKNKVSSIMETFKTKMQGFFNSTSNWLKEHIFGPAKEKLFGKDGLFTKITSDKNKERAKKVFEFFAGKKGEDGTRKGGLLGGTFGAMADTFKKIGQVFTGKDYKDSSGNTVKYDGKTTVFGEIKDTFTNLKDSFVERYIKPKDKDSKSGLMYQLQDGVNTFKEAILGKDAEKVDLDIKKGWESTKEKLPKSMAYGIIGSGIATLSGGGLLGTIGGLFLPGGPLGGMILGSAVGFASQSDKVKNALFGKEDDNGERLGGFISKDFQKWFKEHKSYIAGGAALGAIKGSILGVGAIPAFFLGSGPIGGALMGIGTSMLYKSKLVQDFLFGKQDENGERNNNGFVSKILSKFKSGGKDKNGKPIKPGAIGVGAIGGAALSAIVGKFGLLGGLMTFGGSPIFGALLGAGAGIAAQSDKWSKAVFGEVDENGVRSGGALNKIENLFKVEVFEPIKSKILDYKFNIQEWFIKGIAFPISKAVSPIINEVKYVGNWIKDRFSKRTKAIRDFFKATFKTYVGDPFVRVAKWAFGPIKTLATGLLGISGKILGGIATAPFKLLGALGDHIGKKQERRGLKAMKKKQNEDFFKGYRTLKDTLYNKYFNKELREQARTGKEGSNTGGESIHKQRFDARKEAWKYKARMAKGAFTGEEKFGHGIYEALFGEEGKYKFWDRGRFENSDDELFSRMNKRIEDARAKREHQRNQTKLRREAARFLGYDNKKDGQDLSALYDPNSEIIKDENGNFRIRKLIETETETNVNNIKANTDLLNDNINNLKDQNVANTDKTVGELQVIRGVVTKMAANMGVDTDKLDEAPKKDESPTQFINRTDENYKKEKEKAEDSEDGKTHFAGANPKDMNGIAGQMAKALDRDNKADQEQWEKNKQIEQNEVKDKKVKSKGVEYFKTKFSEEKKAKEEKDSRSKLIETVIEGNKENKKHHSIWSSIFGKKGLITLALLAGIPLLIKLVKGFVEGDGIGGLIKKILFGEDEYKDGEDNTGKDTGIIGAIRNVIDYKNPDNVVPDDSRRTSGEVLTRLGINTLLRGTTVDKAIGRGLTKGLFKGSETTFGKGVMTSVGAAEKSALKSAEKSTIKSTVNTVFSEGAEKAITKTTGRQVAEEVTEEAVKKGTEKGVKSAVTEGVEKGGSEATEKATKNLLKKINDTTIAKFFNKAIEYLKAFFDTVIVKKLGGTKAGTLFKKILECIQKILGKDTILGKFIDKMKRGLQKIAGLTVGAAMSGGIVNAIITTTDFMAGVYESANIFRCNQKDVNTFMKITAGIIKALLGTTFGILIAIIDEIYQEITDESFVTNFAVDIYACMDGVLGTSQAEHVKTAQKNFKNEKGEWEEKNGVELSVEDYNNLQNDTLLGDVGDKINSLTGGTTKKDIEEFVIWKKQQEASGKQTFKKTDSYVKYKDKYLGSEYKEYVDKTMNSNQKPLEYEDWIASKKEELKENEKLYKKYKASYKSPWDSDTIDIKKNDYYSASFDPNNSQGDAYYKQNAQQVALDSLVDPLQYNNGKYRSLTDLYNDKEVWNSIVAKKYKDIEDLSEVAIYARYNGYGGWGRWLNKDNPEGWIEIDSSGKIVGVHEPTYGASYGKGGDISSAFAKSNVDNYHTTSSSIDDLTVDIQNVSKISGTDKTEIINRYKNLTATFKSSADDMDLMMGKMIGLVDDNGNTLPISKASDNLTTPYSSVKEIYINNTELFSDTLKQVVTIKQKMSKLLNKYPDAFDNMMGTTLGFTGNSLSSAINTTYNKTNTKLSSSSSSKTGGVSSKQSLGTRISNTFKSLTNSISGLFGFGDDTGVNTNLIPQINDDINNLYGMGSTYYSQKDPRWANKKYASINGKDSNSDDIATRGCAPTAMAMVATDLTGKRITPDVISDYSYNRGYSVKGGTNWNMVPNTSRDLGLSSKTLETPNATSIENELSKGKSVIASGVGDGITTPYTRSGHYIVLSGAKNGKVMVKDPNGIYKNGLYDLDKISKQTNKAWSIGKKYGMGFLDDGIQTLKTGQIVNNSNKASDANNIGKKVSEYARSKVGCKYSQDFRMKEGYYDCSSLCYRAYSEGAGLIIQEGSTTHAFEKIPNEVSVENILPGDIILCRYENGHPEHAVLYVGNGEVVNASGKDRGVVLQKLSDTISYYPTYKIKRVLSESQTAEYNGGSSGVTSSSSSSASITPSSIFSSFGTFWQKIYNKALFGEDFNIADLFSDSSVTTGSSNVSSSITSNATATGTSSEETIAKLQSLGATTSLAGNANAATIWNYYKSKGFTDLQTAGLMGNIEAESEYNPSEVYSGHYGIHQWGDDRFASLQNLANSKGTTWSDLNTQLDYAYSELTGSESGTMSPSLWANVTTPSQAADIIREKYERCYNQAAERRRYSAQLAYDSFVNGSGKGYGLGGNDISCMDVDNMDILPTDNYGYGPSLSTRDSNMLTDMKQKDIKEASNVKKIVQSMKRGNLGYGGTDTTNIENLLGQVIDALNTIGNNTSATIDAINSNSGNNTPTIINGTQNTTTRSSVARQKALAIASGQY